MYIKDMKKLIKLGWLGAVACMAIGCSDNDTLGDPDNALRCQGRLGVNGVPSATVVSRAETDGTDLAALCGLTVPEPSALRLKITGDDIKELESGQEGTVEVSTFDYNESWETLTAYNNEKPALFPGDYTAVLEYGDAEAIGPQKPYYRGQATGTVEAGKETSCSVEVKIANSVVRLTATNQFMGYFSDPQFQLYLNGSTEPLKNDEGQPIVFTFAETDPLIFMPAATNVVVKGSVRRPSQTNGTNADGELLPIEVPVRATAAGTLHTFKFTADAGGATITVSFGSFGEDNESIIELNDNATVDDSGSQEGGGASDTPAE